MTPRHRLDGESIHGQHSKSGAFNSRNRFNPLIATNPTILSTSSVLSHSVAVPPGGDITTLVYGLPPPGMVGDVVQHMDE